MSGGMIQVAENCGVYVFKMRGDVRLNLGVNFYQYIENMLSNERFTSVVFDLHEAESLDSTTLGLMAKIALGSKHHNKCKPLALSANASIWRLFDSMGLDELLVGVSDYGSIVGENLDTQELEKSYDETQCQQAVLAAHRTLIELSAANEDKFRELVQTLENTH